MLNTGYRPVPTLTKLRILRFPERWRAVSCWFFKHIVIVVRVENRWLRGLQLLLLIIFFYSNHRSNHHLSVIYPSGNAITISPITKRVFRPLVEIIIESFCRSISDYFTNSLSPCQQELFRGGVKDPA